MYLVALVGPNAAGKSTIAAALASDAELFPIHYRDLDQLALDNRLLLSKWAYIAAWFAGVLQAQRRGTRCLIADRSPFDTAAYISDPAALVAPLEVSVRELSDLGVTPLLINLTAPLQLLQERVKERLRSQPWRERYHELELLPQAVRFFETNGHLWHHRVDTSIPLNEVVDSVRKIIYSAQNGGKGAEFV